MTTTPEPLADIRINEERLLSTLDDLLVIDSLGGPASGLLPDQVGVFNGVDAALHGQTNRSARSARTPQGTEANPNPEHPSGGDVGPPAPPARAHHVSFAPAPFRVTLHEEQEEQPASPTHPSQPPPQQQPLLPTSSHKGAGTAQGHRRRTSMGACVMHRTASFTQTPIHRPDPHQPINPAFHSAGGLHREAGPGAGPGGEPVAAHGD